MAATKEQAYRILHLLKQHYPHAKMILEWGNNFELLVAIILSAQCTDLMVNKVTTKLFPKYKERFPQLRSLYEAEMQKIRTANNLRGKIAGVKEEEIIEMINFGNLPLSELEQDIKPTGFYHNKAKSLQAAAKTVIDKCLGIIPRTIAELTTIPGVGRKTANVFLGNAYHIYEGIAVDTHVSKQSQTLGLTKQANPDKIERDLMNLFDKKDWFKLTYLLIEHGRNMRRKKTDRTVCNNKDCILCARD